MKLASKKNDIKYVYITPRENEEKEIYIEEDINNLVKSNEEEERIERIIKVINEHRTNKIYEWQEKEEIQRQLIKEPLLYDDIRIIDEELKNTQLYKAINQNRKEVEYQTLRNDIEEMKIQIKHMREELFKLNDICAAMSEAVYND